MRPLYLAPIAPMIFVSAEASHSVRPAPLEALAVAMALGAHSCPSLWTIGMQHYSSAHA